MPDGNNAIAGGVGLLWTGYKTTRGPSVQGDRGDDTRNTKDAGPVCGLACTPGSELRGTVARTRHLFFESSAPKKAQYAYTARYPFWDPPDFAVDVGPALRQL